MYNHHMIYKTLREVFALKRIKFVDVARKAGYTRQTVHNNLDEVPDFVSVRALRNLAAVVGAKVVIHFEIDN